MQSEYDPDELDRVFESLISVPYGDEPVDQYSHAFQCAGRALAAGADDELVVAALLHDVGRSPVVAATCPPGPHDRIAARWCSTRFGHRVAWLVEAHVAAKRYLVAIEPGYRANLTKASLDDLVDQGGPFTSHELDLWSVHPWSVDAVRLRRWDDAAKVFGAPLPDPAVIADLLRRVAASMGDHRDGPHEAVA